MAGKGEGVLRCGEHGQEGTASPGRKATSQWAKSCSSPSPFSWCHSLQQGELNLCHLLGFSVKNNHSIMEKVGQFMANKHKS